MRSFRMYGRARYELLQTVRTHLRRKKSPAVVANRSFELMSNSIDSTLAYGNFVLISPARQQRRR